MFIKTMKILYIANIRVPTTRAHGLQIVKTCEALNNSGVDLTLVSPFRENEIKEDIFEYYKVKVKFNLDFIRFFGFARFGRYGSSFESIIFYTQSILKYLFVDHDTVIYSRDAWPLLIFSYLGKNVCFESHSGRGDSVVKKLLKRKNLRVVVITKGIKDYFVSIGVSANIIHVAPDGVDVDQFLTLESKEELRKELGLHVDKKIIMYVGSINFYDWKGSDLFLEASKNFPEAVFVSIGGNEEGLNKLSNEYKNPNLVLIQQQSNYLIPKYLKCADILVLPNRGNNEVSLKYTSPMKLFEYMASGNIILASNLPSIREILNDENAVFFEPEQKGNIDLLIQEILEDIDSYRKLGLKAQNDALNYDWNVRARGIVDFLGN